MGFVTWGNTACFPPRVVIHFSHSRRKKKIYEYVQQVQRHKMVVVRSLSFPLACSLTGVFRCHHECLGGDSISRQGNREKEAALVTDRLNLWFALVGGGRRKNGYHNPLCVSPSPSVHLVFHVSPHVSLLNSHLSVLRHPAVGVVVADHQNASVRESPLWVTSRFMSNTLHAEPMNHVQFY